MEETAKKFNMNMHTVKHYCPNYAQLARQKRHWRLLTPKEQVQVLFLRSFSKLSQTEVGQLFQCSRRAVFWAERVNRELKQTFRKFKQELAVEYGKEFTDIVRNLVLDGMKATLAEAFSPEKIQSASYRDLINGFAQLHNSITGYLPEEKTNSTDNTEAVNRLTDALCTSIKEAEPMSKPEMESMYYMDS